MFPHTGNSPTVALAWWGLICLAVAYLLWMRGMALTTVAVAGIGLGAMVGTRVGGARTKWTLLVVSMLAVGMLMTFSTG
jgi:LPXTG-motif cell wall-anchored protein